MVTGMQLFVLKSFQGFSNTKLIFVIHLQGPIGTTIIFRQCVSRIFYKKPFNTIKKPLFCDIPHFVFFNKNCQLLIYSTNTFFMQHWGHQDDFKVHMSPENI